MNSTQYLRTKCCGVVIASVNYLSKFHSQTQCYVLFSTTIKRSHLTQETRSLT
ncbi:MAG TPA: hypothetical protein V6D14_03160 [Coleofasciculaceae cyanobacterium]